MASPHLIRWHPAKYFCRDNSEAVHVRMPRWSRCLAPRSNSGAAQYILYALVTTSSLSSDWCPGLGEFNLPVFHGSLGSCRYSQSATFTFHRPSRKPEVDVCLPWVIPWRRRKSTPDATWRDIENLKLSHKLYLVGFFQHIHEGSFLSTITSRDRHLA